MTVWEFKEISLSLKTDQNMNQIMIHDFMNQNMKILRFVKIV